MAIYKCEYRIGIDDIGKLNELTNKSILKILENAGGMHSDSVGYGINDIDKTGVSWVLLGWRVKVIKRPRYNELLSINTWSRNSNKIATYRDYEIYNQKGELCIIATSKWVIIDIKNLSLRTITSEIIEAYQGETKNVFDEKDIKKLKEPDTIDNQINYKILRSHIDINKHVHNLYYLDFAYEVLPEDVYNSHEFDNIEIIYKKQIKLGDDIVCLYKKEDNENIISIKSKDKKELHAIIKLY